jgi:hypothetical protein
MEFGQPLKFHVSLYFWLSSFNVDSDLLLLHNMHSSKAFLIHCVKLSSLTNRRYIPTFLLQRLLHLLLHTPYQHNCHLSQTNVVNTYNKDFLNVFLVFNKRMNCKNNETLKEIIPAFSMKINSFYWIFQQESYWTRNNGFVSMEWSPNVKPTRWIFKCFWVLDWKLVQTWTP